MSLEISTSLQIESVDASADRGGWQINATFLNDFEEAQYGRREETYILGAGLGVWEPAKHLVINGSMFPQSVSFTKRQSSTPILISTSDYYLNNAGHQGIYFSNVSPSTNPHQIPGLTLGAIVRHIVEQHCNISIQSASGWADTTGIDVANSTSVEVYTVRQSNSMWATIENIASNEFYVRYFTKKDRLIYEPHPQFRTVIPSVVMTFDQNNIIETPEITFRNDVLVDQVQMYALTDTGNILQAFYPAQVGTEMRRQKFSNIRCNSQARLNLLAQRAFKFLNRELNFHVAIAGAWGAYLELYDRVQVTYAGTDANGLTINWNKKKFWINSIRISRQGNFNATTEFDLEEENL